MNKWLVLAASSLIMVNAHAKQTSCGYKDYFHLSDKTPGHFYIDSGYFESDVYLQYLGPRSFIIRDGYECRAGYAQVKVASDPNNFCVLDIQDGPFMNDPIINASCVGAMHYMGTKYDGFGSYSYSINFF